MTQGGLLVVLGHPDDESLVCGTMGHYVDRGVPVTMVCATRGEVGQIAPGSGATAETLGKFREQELRDACAHVGVTDVRFLGWRDSGMAGTPDNDNPRCFHRADAGEATRAIVTLIRELKPAAVVTWDPTGGYGHPDHVATHLHTTSAFHAAGDGSRYADAGEPWQPTSLFYSLIPLDEFNAVFEELRALGLYEGDPPGDEATMNSMQPPPINTVIDVEAQFERKQLAFSSHKTQAQDFGIFTKMPEPMQRKLFRAEVYHRAIPPVPEGAIIDDLLS